MTILNGKPIGDPAPKPTPSVTPATSTQIDPGNFILSIMALFLAISIPVAGAIMGGIAIAQSRRAGQPNTIAKVAFWIGLVLTILIVAVTVVSVVLGVSLFSNLLQACTNGVVTPHDNGVTYTCN